MFHTRVWQYATSTPGAWKGQKRELVFSGAVATDGCKLPCVLGIEAKSSERAASTANCETNPSAPPALFLSEKNGYELIRRTYWLWREDLAGESVGCYCKEPTVPMSAHKHLWLQLQGIRWHLLASMGRHLHSHVHIHTEAHTCVYLI